MTAEQNLSAAEAEDRLPDGPVVHAITQSGNEMDGEDWPRDRVLALLHDAAVIRPAPERFRAIGHGLEVLSNQGEVIFIGTGARRDRLHYAIGTFAARLIGQASEAEVQAAVAALAPGQEAEYAERTEALRREHGSRA
jgi:hypothetical protein